MSRKRPRAARSIGFPAGYKRLAPIDRLRWLKGDECRRAVECGQLQQTRVTAEMERLRKASVEMSKIVPTPAWLEDFERGNAFPPVADNPRTSMRQATRVLCEEEKPILWPAAYLSDSGATYDVVLLKTDLIIRAMELDGPGPNGVSRKTPLRADEVVDLGLVELKVDLPPEDENSLRAEIAEFFGAEGRRAVRMTV